MLSSSGHAQEEIIISGPAGTGKTRAGLYKLHKAAIKYPGMRLGHCQED